MILDRFSKRERILLLATLVIVFVAFGYSLIIEPLAGRWNTLNRQVAQQTLKLDKSLRILQKEAKIREEFNKYAKHAVSRGTDDEIIAVLLKAIEQKAGLTRTHITNIRPREVKDAGPYKEFTFEVISESGLKDLLGFIYELQNSPELLKVKRLTLALKTGKTQDLRAIMEIVKVSIKTP